LITKEQIYDEVDRIDDEKIVAFMQTLIQIDTSVPPGNNYREYVNVVSKYFKALNYELKEVIIPEDLVRQIPSPLEGPRINLIAYKDYSQQEWINFYGHMDVVPAEGWDAFSPRFENGKVYGRGAADMKGSIVALLGGLERLCQKPLKYDVSVMVTTDEEVNQASQIRYLGQFLEPLAGGYFFSLDSPFGYVGIANLGVLQMNIKVKGKSVHSGLANLGENAVEKANLLINALTSLKQRVTQRKSEVATDPATGLARMEARLNINMIQGWPPVLLPPVVLWAS